MFTHSSCCTHVARTEPCTNIDFIHCISLTARDRVHQLTASYDVLVRYQLRFGNDSPKQCKGHTTIKTCIVTRTYQYYNVAIHCVVTIRHTLQHHAAFSTNTQRLK
jgi:hypothetical protein